MRNLILTLGFLIFAPAVLVAAPAEAAPALRLAEADPASPSGDRARLGDSSPEAVGASRPDLDDYLFFHSQAVRGESRTVSLPWPELRIMAN
jgi:hypothetical protein